MALMRLDVHVGPFLYLGDRWLLHMQHFGQHLLRQALGLVQLVKRHFRQYLPGHAIRLLACSLSHTCAWSHEYCCCAGAPALAPAFPATAPMPLMALRFI